MVPFYMLVSCLSIFQGTVFITVFLFDTKPKSIKFILNAMEFSPEEVPGLPIVAALNGYFYFPEIPVFISLRL